MRRSKVIAIASLATFGLSAVVSAQEVYQWKDANGVTHYTDLPPPQAHKTRDIDNKSGNAAEIATVKPVENEQCANSRSNLTRLQTNQAVGVDTDGDGKADREISASERSSQTELNQAAVKAYCPPAKP